MPLRHAILRAVTCRWTVVASAAAVAVALAAGHLPLLEVPGLELGLLASIACGLLLGPVAGLAAIRREGPPGPTGAPVLRPFLAAAAATLLPVALLLAAGASLAALRTPCRPLLGAPWFVIVAVPSALLAAAIGVAAGVLARGRRIAAAAAYAVAAGASLGATLLAGYLGPSAAAYDHLLGIWPGPLYDEALAIDRRLVLFRLGTLAWTATALAAAGVVARRRAGRGAGAAALGAVLALSVALAARAAGGGTATRSELAAALGAVREGPRCVVHLAAERGAEEADRALRDCEYDAAAVAGALGLAAPPRATVWIHRSPEEKRRLVGAGATSFTKPWLAEIHVHDQGLPHPLLRHELVHALASQAARGPLRVPARLGVLFDAGLIEGLAVALEVPAGDHGVHAWARAMRDQGRLPPAAALLGTGGFLRAAPARAYTAAGSLLRFVLSEHGAGAVLRAYRDDDLARAVGLPLPAIEAEWHRFLDAVPVPPALATAADARFERGSLFSRGCAREVAALEHAAGVEAGRGRADLAETALRRAAALAGGDPGFLRTAAEAWVKAGDEGRAEALAREALAAARAAGARPALRQRLLATLGDLRLRAGAAPEAAERYREALALGAEGAEDRALRARLAAAGDVAVADAVSPWLLAIGDPGLALARLEGSPAPLARYLLARAQLARGAPALALGQLARLDPAGLPSAAFALEARRLAAEALCLTGRWEGGIAAWEALAREEPTDGARERAADAARRCAFERDAARTPPRWDGDWPRGR